MIAACSARRIFSKKPKRSMKVTINRITTIHARYHRNQPAETNRVLVMRVRFSKNHPLSGVNK